jgi:zinc transport system substrate-binding protein
MRFRSVACSLFVLAALAAEPARAADLDVVVTLKPAHSLVAAVMEGVATPRLIVGGAASGHTYSLKPSDAAALAKARVLVRVDESVEPFTRKLIASLPKSVKVVTLSEVSGLRLLPIRKGGGFEEHDHDDHSHGHGQGGKSAAKGKTEIDGHLWLDPNNAKLIAAALATMLSEIRPEHASVFKANAERLGKRLDELVATIAAEMKPLAGRPYIVFHDAYQYFEQRFGLTPVGSITVNPETPPSGKRLQGLRKKVASLDAVCVMSEPQFDAKVANAVTTGTKSRSGVLDPLGAKLEPGPGLYPALIANLAAALKSCLGDARA